MTLFSNVVRVTQDPRKAYRALELGRLALREGALQKLSELVPFLTLVGRPHTIVEVGAGSGGLLRALCALGSDDATIVSVDLEGGPFGGGASDEELRRRANPGPRQELHLVRGNSRDSAVHQQVHELIPTAIELLFIDGDHTYEGVSADYRLYAPLVAPGGVIALHDILPHSHYPEVQVHRLWRELTGVEKREIVSPDELDDTGSTWGGIGVIVTRAEPAGAPHRSCERQLDSV